MRNTNLKQTQVRVIKADLIEQGIIKEVVYGRSKKYEYQFNAPELNTQSFEELRNTKLKELDSMIDYVYTKEPRMRFLCNYLGDKTDADFDNCDNTRYKKRIVKQSEVYVRRLKEFRENYFPELIVESNTSNIIKQIYK